MARGFEGEKRVTLQRVKWGITLVGLSALAACAPPPPPPAPTPPPVVIVPPPPPPPPRLMPTPPNSASPTLVIPALDPLTGQRLTPNVNLSPEQALWHLRIALNVAALNCRGPDEAVLVANYTRFLNTNRAAIARAERWVIADQGRRTGTNGIAVRDALSTRLYNYFAQPPAQTNFCAVATNVTAAAAVEPTATILPFSTARLVEVDQPFVDFYAAYDRYLADLAQWRAEQPAAPTAVIPAATPPVTTPAPAPTAPPPG